MNKIAGRKTMNALVVNLAACHKRIGISLNSTTLLTHFKHWWNPGGAPTIGWTLSGMFARKSFVLRRNKASEGARVKCTWLILYCVTSYSSCAPSHSFMSFPCLSPATWKSTLIPQKLSFHRSLFEGVSGYQEILSTVQTRLFVHAEIADISPDIALWRLRRKAIYSGLALKFLFVICGVLPRITHTWRWQTTLSLILYSIALNTSLSIIPLCQHVTQVNLPAYTPA